MCPPVRHPIEWWNRARIRYFLRALREPAQQVKNAMSALLATNQVLERIYLATQQDLEALARLAGEVVVNAQGLVNMALGRQTGATDFNRTIAVLQGPLDFLGHSMQQMAELASDISLARTSVSSITALEMPLERTLSPLKFMQTMFRVESAVLPAESRETFLNLASEIGFVFERVERSFSQQFAALAQLETSLGAAMQRMESYIKERGGHLEQRRAEIARSLAAMSEEIEQNDRRNVELSQASQDFSASVNSAIMALQTQDIVAQRLDHAVRGLSDAVEALRAAESDADRDAAGRIPTLAYVEIGQLDAVAEQLHESEQSLRAAVGAILARIGGLNNECLLLREFGHLTVSVEGVVQVLVDSLAGLRAMTAETMEMIRRHEEALLPAQNALAALSGTVDEVARSMARIALNAQIRAVQVGENTGLEVLASHTAELTRETVRISGELNAGFDDTSTRLGAAIARLQRLREAGEQALARCEQDGAAEEAGLHTFRDQVLASMQQMAALFERCRAAGQTVLSRCDLSASIASVADARAAVERLARCAEPLKPPAAASQASGAERRYTMSGERHVHYRVLRQLGAETPAPVPVENSSNIELF